MQLIGGYTLRSGDLFRGDKTLTKDYYYFSGNLARQTNRFTYLDVLYYLNSGSKLPDRKTSIMMSTSRSVAASYGNVYIVIPQDNANIAVCKNDDFGKSLALSSAMKQLDLTSFGHEAFIDILAPIYNVNTIEKFIHMTSLREYLNKKSVPALSKSAYLYLALYMHNIKIDIGDTNFNYNTTYEKYENILNKTRIHDILDYHLSPTKLHTRTVKFSNLPHEEYTLECGTHKPCILIKQSKYTELQNS